MSIENIRKSIEIPDWLDASGIDLPCGEPYRVVKFSNRTAYKAHFVTHVLGFMFDDDFWDKEYWKGLYGYLKNLDTNKRETIVNNLIKSAKCEAAKIRGRKLGKHTSFDRICAKCEINGPNSRCNEILYPLLDEWELIIKEALKSTHNCPRYIQCIYNKGLKGQPCMLHLDNYGVLVISRDDKREHTFENLYIFTCYRPTPPLNCILNPEGRIDWIKKNKYDKKLGKGEIKKTKVTCTERTWRSAECEKFEKPSEPSVPSCRGYHHGFKLKEIVGEQVVKELKESIAGGKRKNLS